MPHVDNVVPDLPAQSDLRATQLSKTDERALNAQAVLKLHCPQTCGRDNGYNVMIFLFQIQTPSIASVLDMLNVINGIVFVQIR